MVIIFIIQSVRFLSTMTYLTIGMDAVNNKRAGILGSRKASSPNYTLAKEQRLKEPDKLYGQT